MIRPRAPAADQPFSQAPSAALPWWKAWAEYLTTALIFLIALPARALAHNSIITVDEAYHWFSRVELFLQTLRAGDYAGTNLIGHPGVTTMWLGALGALLHEALAGLGLLSAGDPNLHRALLRLPVAVVTALAVALAYPLLRRLLGQPVALLAALFWATDPFLVAHSQLLHLDALLTSFLTLALLAALLAFRIDDSNERRPIRWPALLASGVAGGLALLTKSPSAILPALLGLVALTGCWPALRDPGRLISRCWPLLATRLVIPLLLWSGVALLVCFALWPALWVDPRGSFVAVFLQAEADGGTPHGWGNFFLGQPVADPGPLFYPVALALRMTPWALVGVLAYAGLRGWEAGLRPGDQRRLASPAHKATLLLALFGVLFLAMMSIPPKKFDRYALPVFPVLDILAASGLAQLVTRLRPQAPIDWPSLTDERRRLAYVASWTLLTLALAANLAWFHPYELAYYNPLLGGARVAAQAIPIGWGEGYEQVAAYLMAQPDGKDRPIAAWFEPVLRPNVDNHVVPLSWIYEPGRVDYAMLYIDQLQRRNLPQAIKLLRRYTPIHTVRIHGIDYAYIYQLPQPVAQPVPADFSEAIHFRGYDLDSSAVRSTGLLTVTLHWQALAPLATDYTLFAHVLDERGQRVGQADVPPGGPRAPTSTWQAGHYINAIQGIPMQADAPTGRYWIAIGLYAPDSFARLPLRATQPAGAPGDGSEALLLGPFSLP